MPRFIGPRRLHTTYLHHLPLALMIGAGNIVFRRHFERLAENRLKTNTSTCATHQPRADSTQPTLKDDGMKNRLAQILSFITAVGIAASSTAQEIERTSNPQDDGKKSSAAVRREPQLVISVTLNGDQYVNRVECIAVADPLEEYSLLRLEPVRDELGLEKSFQSKMSSATKKADDARREILHGRPKFLPSRRAAGNSRTGIELGKLF